MYRFVKINRSVIEISYQHILVVQQLNKQHNSTLLAQVCLCWQCSSCFTNAVTWNFLTFQIASGQIALDQEVLWLLSDSLIQQKTEHADAEPCKVLRIKYVFYLAFQSSKPHSESPPVAVTSASSYLFSKRAVSTDANATSTSSTDTKCGRSSSMNSTDHSSSLELRV